MEARAVRNWVVFSMSGLGALGRQEEKRVRRRWRRYWKRAVGLRVDAAAFSIG